MKVRFLIMLLLLGLASCKDDGDKEEEANSKHFEAPIGNLDTTSIEFQDWRFRIDEHYQNLHRNANFNGCVLVAREGVVIYKNCFGVKDVETKAPLTVNSLFQIASVSKTFTAMAVLKLWDEKKLDLDQKLEAFFPKIPYPNVTIHDLLSHRSGLPNYLQATEKAWADSTKLMSNEELVQFLIKENPPVQAAAGRKFAYNNTNYALLALIIEQVSGMSYADYMEKEIFQPLGMKNTRVFGSENTELPTNNLTTGYLRKNQPDKLVYTDGVVGDKNIYSTVGDLLLWERAVTHNYFFSKNVLDTCTIGQSNERPGRKNYAYGWRTLEKPEGGKLIYHNGWWHGYTAAFYRNPSDETTVIVLSNIYNRNTYRMEALWDILYNNGSTTEFD